MQKRSSDTVRICYPKYSREKLVSTLRNRLKKLLTQLPVRRVVLFGSYVEDRQTASSDIDLLIIYSDPKIQDDYLRVARTLRIEGLESHIYTETEYHSLRDSGSWLLRDAERKGIVILQEDRAHQQRKHPPHSKIIRPRSLLNQNSRNRKARTLD